MIWNALIIALIGLTAITALIEWGYTDYSPKNHKYEN